MIDFAEARKREQSFLDRMSGAQGDYEWLIENEAWTVLGHDSFADWWSARVVPVMRALSMRPTREITAKGIEQVKKEDAALPKTWRHTQQDIGEMFDVPKSTVGNQTRSLPDPNGPRVDLGAPRPQRPGRPTRRSLPDQARDVGWSLRKDVERIQKIAADDRLQENKPQIALHLEGHLRFAIEALAGALQQFTQQGD